MFKRILILGVLAATPLAMTACGISERVSAIGKPPAFSPITNPTAAPDYRPVSLPMPREEESKTLPNSLWSSNRQTFFKDQRARKVGDILTVLISIDDEAKMSNETKRDRTGEESLNLPALAGFQSNVNNILPQAADPANLISTTSDSKTTGKGTINRKEEIDLQLAAVVTQILPNGNMVVQGRQEVRVNYENRVLELMGVIRPEDIETNNRISYEKIAEARIAYGGKGQVSDLQQPRYGQQFLDVVSPF
jgi:flagellar L-ring protein precursor FlgH